MEAIRGAVDRGIRQLASSAAPAENAAPIRSGGDYRFAARTAAEVPAARAANERNLQEAEVNTQAQQAYNNGEMDLFAQLAQVQDPSQSLGYPADAAKPEAPSGMVMSKGGLMLPKQQETPNEGTRGDNDSAVPWLL